MLELLEETHPVYEGLGSPAVARVRGAALLALGRGPLPPVAIPFLLEELESPHDPYLTAAAAHALRRAAEPDAVFLAPLLRALGAVRYRDDTVRLTAWGGYAAEGEPTTAVAEVLESLAWLGGHAKAGLESLRALEAQEPGRQTRQALALVIARIESAPDVVDSCRRAPHESPESPTADPSTVGEIELEDQDGGRARFSDYFVGQPSVVVFFYTRCENALKCPTTITKLGELQRTLRERGLHDRIHTAAITYDPAFDLPARLEQYRRSWGAESWPGHRMLRTTGAFGPLKAYFGLGVSYGPTVVSRHRIEAYLLDSSARIVHRHARTGWDQADVLDQAVSLLESERSHVLPSTRIQ